MRRLVFVSVVCGIGLVARAEIQTQTATQSPSASTNSSSTTAAQISQAAPGLDESRSLFDQTWRQFQFGGRVSSIDGDPARFQRYQDLRDGILFTDARYASEDPSGNWQLRTTA